MIILNQPIATENLFPSEAMSCLMIKYDLDAVQMWSEKLMSYPLHIFSLPIKRGKR